MQCIYTFNDKNIDDVIAQSNHCIYISFEVEENIIENKLVHKNTATNIDSMLFDYMDDKLSAFDVINLLPHKILCLDFVSKYTYHTCCSHITSSTGKHNRNNIYLLTVLDLRFLNVRIMDLHYLIHTAFKQAHIWLEHERKGVLYKFNITSLAETISYICTIFSTALKTLHSGYNLVINQYNNDQAIKGLDENDMYDLKGFGKINVNKRGYDIKLKNRHKIIEPPMNKVYRSRGDIYSRTYMFPENSNIHGSWKDYKSIGVLLDCIDNDNVIDDTIYYVSEHRRHCFTQELLPPETLFNGHHKGNTALLKAYFENDDKKILVKVFRKAIKKNKNNGKIYDGYRFEGYYRVDNLYYNSYIKNIIFILKYVKIEPRVRKYTSNINDDTNDDDDNDNDNNDNINDDNDNDNNDNINDDIDKNNTTNKITVDENKKTKDELNREKMIRLKEKKEKRALQVKEKKEKKKKGKQSKYGGKRNNDKYDKNKRKQEKTE